MNLVSIFLRSIAGPTTCCQDTQGTVSASLELTVAEGLLHSLRVSHSLKLVKLPEDGHYAVSFNVNFTSSAKPWRQGDFNGIFVKADSNLDGCIISL